MHNICRMSFVSTCIISPGVSPFTRLDATTTSCASPSITASPSGLGSRRSVSTRRTSSASPAKTKACPEADQLPEIYAEVTSSGEYMGVSAVSTRYCMHPCYMPAPAQSLLMPMLMPHTHAHAHAHTHAHTHSHAIPPLIPMLTSISLLSLLRLAHSHHRSPTPR